MLGRMRCVSCCVNFALILLSRFEVGTILFFLFFQRYKKMQFSENIEDCIENLESLFKGMMSQFAVRLVTVAIDGEENAGAAISKAMKNVGVNINAGHRAELRRRKFRATWTIEMMNATLLKLKSGVEEGLQQTSVNVVLCLEGIIQAILSVIILENNFGNIAVAAKVGKFGAWLVFGKIVEEAEKLKVLNEVKTFVCEQLSWSNKKWHLQVNVRCRRLKELAEVVGEGGCCLFGAFFSVNDVEGISEDDWKTFVECLDEDLTLFLKNNVGKNVWDCIPRL
ncbi:MAG: hypothetical protein EXX96DRAFT_612930 [Benjaminiella poitrasii]|nr:MAG: hypothetical protein EXX96DRAFT_612930 [Benjaminiella poitrasii]